MDEVGLEKLGFVLRCEEGSGPNEEVRTTVYLKSHTEAEGGSFVAWFGVTRRESDHDSVTGINTQFVHRKDLSAEQVAAVTAWLRAQVTARM